MALFDLVRHKWLSVLGLHFMSTFLLSGATTRANPAVNQPVTLAPQWTAPKGAACPPRISRHMHWNWTAPGQTAIQPCPDDATGLARWQCSPGDSPEWLGIQPNLGDCKSAAMTELEAMVRADDPEEVIVSRLVQVTRPRQGQSGLFGGDLESSVGVLEGVANRLQYRLQKQSMFNAESHIQQVIIINTSCSMVTYFFSFEETCFCNLAEIVFVTRFFFFFADSAKRPPLGRPFAGCR